MVKEAECKRCGKTSKLLSENLGFCLDCIRGFPDEVLPSIREFHRKTREDFGLPVVPPRDPDGVRCRMCVNECQIPGGEMGYCGLRTNRGGKLVNLAGTHERAVVQWYHDPLPTNCVADWVCPGSRQYGYKNLAVFYGACTFNCLFCQNWHYRELFSKMGTRSAQELADSVDDRTFCICYFGGDPTPQLVHALRASELALKKAEDIRICFETNGSMSLAFLKKMASISLKSGGCIKFDLKAWDESLHIALTGATNKRTLANFRSLAKFGREKSRSPFLIASTLLIPGYIDEKEVRRIAQFISALDPEIPYSLLGFYPHFYMRDLPTTSVSHARVCQEAALAAGLKQVRIANPHLLGEEY